MSLQKEFNKGFDILGWAHTLINGKESDLVTPKQPKEAAFTRDSDIVVKPTKPQAGENFVSKTWNQIPENMKPVALIGGAVGSFFLLKKIFK